MYVGSMVVDWVGIDVGVHMWVSVLLLAFV